MTKKGQSLIEYSVVLSIVVMVLFAMSPMVKRISQGMIKVVADQIGNQKNSDQPFDDTGHMVESNTITSARTSKTSADVMDVVGYNYDDASRTQVNQLTNMGFFEEN